MYSFDFEHLPSDDADWVPPDDDPSSSPRSSADSSPVTWRCWTCGNDTFTWIEESWKCASCRGEDFYNTSESTRRETSEGAWVFIPRQNSDHAAASPPVDSNVDVGVDGAGLSAGPKLGHSLPPQGEGRERGESEAPTDDPIIDPETNIPINRRRRHRTRKNKAQYDTDNPDHDHPTAVPSVSPNQPQVEPNRELNKTLNLLAKSLQSVADGTTKFGSGHSDRSWNSRMGPEKGIKYKTGAPPQPPTWRYSKDDLRSFAKWQKKLQVWKLQIASYMSMREASLLLYTSLTGEAEEELEHVAIDRIDSADGIAYIEEQLKLGLQTKLVYQKRKLMADYENIVRQHGESLRSFANRYRRSERALETVDIKVCGMYDDDSRGNRLLERSRLSPENARLVLIGSSYSLSFDSICESLCMSFPEHKPPPALFGKDGQLIKPRQGFQSTSSSSSSSSSASGLSHRDRDGKGKGKGLGKNKFRQAYVTEHEEQQDQLDPIEEEFDTPPEGEVDDVEPDNPPAEEEADEELVPADQEVDAQELAEVLTVTAKKLQSLTLGRKFSGSRTIEERKRTSSCSACGVQGHWMGDAACPKGGKAKGKGGKSTFKSKDNSKSKDDTHASKRVYFTVRHEDGSETSHGTRDQPDQPSTPSYFTFVTYVGLPTFEVFVGASLSGYMVIDTACQRTCCGMDWLVAHESLLQEHRLRTMKLPASEAFQFGSGSPIVAKDRVYLPSCVAKQFMLIGASIVDAQIPLLASNTLLETLKAVIDVGQSVIHFDAFGISVQLHKISGHLAISLIDFPTRVHEHVVWQHLSHDSFWKSPHPEVIALELGSPQSDRPESSKPSGVFAIDVPAATSDMASGLAEARGPDMQSRAHHLEMDVSPGEARSIRSQVADNDGDTSTEGARPAARPFEARSTERSIRLQPPRMEEAREQARQLRNVHPVSHSNEVESRQSFMGSFSWLIGFSKIFLAAALLLKYVAASFITTSTGSIQQQEQSHAQVPYATHGEIFTPTFEQAFDQLGSLRLSSSNTADGYLHGRRVRPDELGKSPGGLGSSRRGSGAGRDLGRRSGLGPDHRGHLQLNDTGLSKGQKNNLIGKIRKAKHAAQVETQIYEALAAKHKNNRSRIDILETFAGRGPISNRAAQFGLSACTPMDYSTGYDLAAPSHQKLVRQVLDQYLPLFLIQSLHCTPWTLLQDNVNYIQNPEALHQWREEERPTLQEAMRWCRIQHRGGRFYLLENPLTSRLWQEESVQRMLEDTGGMTVTCHSGAYGGKNSQGEPIRKAFRFASNSKDILSLLSKRLDADQLKLCTPLEGKETTLSQEYPPDLVSAILQGVKAVARSFNPTRFQIRKVYATFSKPSDDQDGWTKVISDARDLFDTSSTSNIIIEKNQPLHKKVQSLVPWELTRLQVALRPVVQRLPQHVPHTHRGYVLKYTKGDTLDIVSEDLSDVHFPRGRFKSPVDIGVFFYGYPNMADEEHGVPGEEFAAQDQLPTAQAARSNPTQEIFHDEITFPNTSGIDRSIKAAVARMHRNMGHLSPSELFKLLALNGITSDHVIKATRAMSCASCQRAKTPTAPNPAAPPQYLGQFADNLQADIFYARDLTSKNYPILGVICEATHLHSAIRLESRQPSHVAQALRTAWTRNFGYPLRLAVDDDGAFKSDFHEFCDGGGTHLEFIPPEAHHKLGVIERHNGTLRMLIEKIVDSIPCTSAEQLDNAIMNYVKWRRTIDAISGDIIFEGIFDSSTEDDEKWNFGEFKDTVTELWSSTPPAETTTFEVFEDGVKEVELGWDGSSENPLPPSKSYYKIYATSLAQTVQDNSSRPSDTETDVEDFSQGHPAKLTRQEQKAIEKELHWKEIMAQSDDYIEEFVKATQKEEASFLQWKTLKPVPPDEAQKILNDPVLRKRVISSRACYRDKNKNVPPLRAKTRIVARGNQDPDLRSLTRQAATPSRVSEMLTFVSFVSGLHGKAFRSPQTWRLWCGDVATAFLQGQQDPSERAGKLYLKAPVDPIIKRAKAFTSTLYEIVGNLYGLSNAPYTWACEVTSRLEKLGFRIHSFDSMMFYYVDPASNSPCAVLICYVDDFLVTFNPAFPFEKFLNSFKWGAQQFLEEGKPLTFKGKELHLERTGAVQTLRIVQQTFIKSIEKGRVDKGLKKSDLLDPRHWPEFRSISGCLQWLAGQSRPDIASSISLSNRGQETTYADLDHLYKTLDYVQESSELGLRIFPVPVDDSSVIMAFSDASWANAQGSASQHGCLLFVAPATITEAPCHGAICDWKSGRSKRVCRSTLAAESVAADSAADRIAFLQYSLGELIFLEPAHRVGPRLRAILATDCKSLFDSITAPNPTVEDKRSLVNIRSIQEVISRHAIHWVPTRLQRADSLTKISEDLRRELLEWLQKPLIQLREVTTRSKEKYSSVKVEHG